MKRLILILGIIFLGCSAPTITSNCDNSANFSIYKTFAFKNNPENINPSLSEYHTDAFRVLIEKGIGNELMKLGYRKVLDSADLIVAYDVLIKNMLDPRVDSAVIYKPWVDTKIDSFNYTEGLLVIRLIDHDKNKMVWQGSLSGILNRKPEKFGEMVDVYICKLFDALAKQLQ